VTDSETEKPAKSARGMRGLLIAIVVVVAGWSAFWWISADLVDAGFDDVIARQAAEGTTITCGNRSIGGWPFKIRVACAPLEIARPDGSRLSLKAARAVALIYQPQHIIAEADGPATINPLGLTPDGRAEWKLAQASIKLGVEDPHAVSVALENPHLDGFAALGLNADLTSKVLEAHTRYVGEGANRRRDVALVAKELSPGDDGFPLDGEVLIRLADPERAGGTPLMLTAEPRELTIERATLTDGTTRLSVSGTLTADAATGVNGELDLIVEDPDHLAPLLARLLPPDSPLAKSIAGAVSGFGKRSEVAGKTQVELPVKVVDGAVSLGIIPLGRIPLHRLPGVL